jgi:hypothetical protein
MVFADYKDVYQQVSKPMLKAKQRWTSPANQPLLDLTRLAMAALTRQWLLLSV